MTRYPDDHDAVASYIRAYVGRGCPEPEPMMLEQFAKRLHRCTPWAGTPIPWEEMPIRARNDTIDKAYAMLAGARAAMGMMKTETIAEYQRLVCGHEWEALDGNGDPLPNAQPHSCRLPKGHTSVDHYCCPLPGGGTIL